MKRPLKIYVDCDDVVTETALRLMEIRRGEGGWAPESFEEMHDFDLHKSLRLDAEEYVAFMTRVHHPDVLGALEALPGACETLRAWLDDGLAPVIVTGRPAFSHATTRAWLDERGLADLPLMLVDKYNRALGASVPGVETVPFARLREAGFDLAVDDAPAALDLLAESGLCPYIVFDRPWNRAYNPVVPRVRSWAELDRAVRERAGMGC